MKVSVDLSGSRFANDDLCMLNDCYMVLSDLMLPDLPIDGRGRQRLSTLLTVLNAVQDALLTSLPVAPPDPS